MWESQPSANHENPYRFLRLVRWRTIETSLCATCDKIDVGPCPIYGCGCPTFCDCWIMDGSGFGSLSRLKLCLRPCPLPIPLAVFQTPGSRCLRESRLPIWLCCISLSRMDGQMVPPATPIQKSIATARKTQSRPLAAFDRRCVWDSMGFVGIRRASFFARSLLTRGLTSYRRRPTH